MKLGLDQRGQAENSAVSAGVSTLFALATIIIFGVFMLLFLFATVIWIWSLVDVLKRTDWKDDNEKVVWIILILFVGFVGSIVYYFVVYKPRKLSKPIPPKVPKATKTK